MKQVEDRLPEIVLYFIRFISGKRCGKQSEASTVKTISQFGPTDPEWISILNLFTKVLNGDRVYPHKPTAPSVTTISKREGTTHSTWPPSPTKAKNNSKVKIQEMTFLLKFATKPARKKSAEWIHWKTTPKETLLKKEKKAWNRLSKESILWRKINASSAPHWKTSLIVLRTFSINLRKKFTKKKKKKLVNHLLGSKWMKNSWKVY